MTSLQPSYFDRLYAESDDPWGFGSRWYEERKYALTLAALPERRYASGYEPGCSIGVLTAGLASRCDQLLASDVSATAVEIARRRLADLPQVTVEQRRLPDEWPSASFDLVVLSELLYYFGDDDLDQVVGSALAATAPGGALVAVHWRHPVSDYPRSGDDVHRRLGDAAAGLARVARHVEDDFWLDVYRRPLASEPPDGLSVAQQEGLA